MKVAGYGPCDKNCRLSQLDTYVADGAYAETEVALHAEEGKATVKGDSGGPAFIIEDGKAYIFGVLNWGDRWKAHMDVYSIIQSHLLWLNEATQRLRTSGVSHGPGWGDHSAPAVPSFK